MFDFISDFFGGLGLGSTAVDTGSVVVDEATNLFGEILGTVAGLADS